MPDGGFVYALINPSMPGLVKVGKTARNPENRARELSASTGVPDAFVLVYDMYFQDCDRAEGHVHAILEQKQYRLSKDREFFQASLKEVINAILEAKSVLDRSPTGNLELESSELAIQDGVFGTETEVLVRELVEKGDSHYWGLGEYLQDYVEAAKYYKQAARMGSGWACRMLGEMCCLGEGCSKNCAEALEYWKRGVTMGCDVCHADMALLFMSKGQFANATKCWQAYFGGMNSQQDSPRADFLREVACKLLLLCWLAFFGDEPRFNAGEWQIMSSVKEPLLEFARWGLAISREAGAEPLELYQYDYAIRKIEEQL